MFGKRSDQPRTADDRARAAANRAARRAGRPLPPDAFEHTVRPPDVEPHEPLRREAPAESAPPSRTEAPAEPRRTEEDVPAARRPTGAEAASSAAAPPAETPAPTGDASPQSETLSDAAAQRGEAGPGAAGSRAEAAAPRGDVAPDAVAPSSETTPAAPRADSASAAARGETAPAVAAPRADSASGPAAAHGEATPAADTPRADADAPNGNGGAIDDAARAAAAAEARALRDSAAPTPSDEPPREELVHQPTVEYTPFQTEEHRALEASAPRDDEPRLIPAQGFPGDDDEVQAFATGAHDVNTDTGEHAPPEETEVRPPVPLRKAPDRPAEPTPRRAAPNAPRGRSRPPKAPKAPRANGGAHWARRIFTLLVVLVLVIVLYGFNKTFQPFHGAGSGSVSVTIPENTDTAGIAKLLADKGVIDSARFFELNAKISGDRDKLRPGKYTLQKGMSNGDVITALSKVPDAPKAVATNDVTLIEGPSIKENAPVVDKSGKVEGSYAKAASSEAVLKRIRALGAPKGTKTAEGFLFPATYKLEEGSPASKLVDQQLDAFDANFKSIDMKYAKSKKLTRYDVLIIASMIEREAQLARERSLVSAVIYNRLKAGMPLAIDATTRYSTNNWQKPILQSQLDKDEPYNTRLNRGLPPTPIGNPGLASLKAAAKPSSKKYLFYVRKPGKSGEHAFSTTDAQFEKDRQRYQASRNGG